MIYIYNKVNFYSDGQELIQTFRAHLKSFKVSDIKYFVALTSLIDRKRTRQRGRIWCLKYGHMDVSSLFLFLFKSYWRENYAYIYMWHFNIRGHFENKTDNGCLLNEFFTIASYYIY